MVRLIKYLFRGLGRMVLGTLERLFYAVVVICTIAAIVAYATNYTMTQGAGTTFGSIVVGGVNYAQQFICDLTTPAQCAAVSAGGAVKVDNSAVTQPANVTQFGGTNVSTGTGASGTGIPRVTVANDSNVLATQSGNWTTRAVGNAGAIFDFAGQATTSPANSLQVGAQFLTVPTTLTNGQSSPLQMDNAGNLLVNVKAGSAALANPIPDRQSSIGTLTTTAANHGACAANSCVTLNSQGAASVLIDISANTNVTLVVECAGPNNNYVACPAYPTGIAAPTGITTISGTTGQWIVPSGGFANVSVRVSSVGSTPTSTVALEANAGDNLALIAAWLSQLHTDLGGATPAGTNRIGFVTLQTDTTGGATSFHALSAANNNSTSVKGSAGTVYSLTVVQTTTTLGDFRFYDSASAPTCSSATGAIANYAIQSNATSPGLHLVFPYGKAFANGIGFCLTGAVADNDNTNFVTGAQINIEWK